MRAAAAIILITAPLLFNLFFLLLSRWFEYPDILRKPTPYILARFRAGGTRLVLAWWGFMMAGVVLLPGVILLAQVMAGDRLAILPVTVVFGVLAGLVQIVGLLRWVYLVPYLARTHEDPRPARRPARPPRWCFNRSTESSVWGWASTSVTCSQDCGRCSSG